jgi:hypothetical protein
VEIAIERLPCTRVFSDDMKSGYEVVIADLPPNVTVLRFYNSW